MDVDKEQKLWKAFARQYDLTLQQLQNFQRYYEMLIAANAQFDLTTVTELSSVLAYHFADSLELGKFVSFNSIAGLVDVGSGAGFPGLALKIKYPHVSVVLIEVTHKRVQFLESVIRELGLINIEVYPHDWRTFLRKTSYATATLFCARASLQPIELLRMFRPGCFYKNAHLVYWAAADWHSGAKEASFVQHEFTYTTGRKRRKYVLFGNGPL